MLFIKESLKTYTLSIIGAILIIINGLWIASNGSAIILQSYPVSSVDQLNSTSFWGRVSFGIPGYVESAFLALWLFLAVINLLGSILLYINPKKYHNLSLLIIICSFLSIPIGGGFVIGFLLGIIGGFAAIEWPKPLKECFVGRFIRAIRLDSSLFKFVSDNQKYLEEAVWVLILINALSGFGYGLYSLNLAKIAESAQTKFNILLLGEIRFDISVFSHSLIYMSLALIKWLILSTLIYLVGVKIAGSKSELDRVARVVAFAYVPVGLQVFLPLVFSNQPIQWALGVFFITNIWMIFALVVGTKEALEIHLAKAVGLVMFCGGIYWIINYTFILPVIDIQGVWFTLQPSSLVLILFAITMVLATLMGTFKRR